MKSFLISIKPEFVEKILNGEKTVEIRKTKPNVKLPCKVYIYCTKGKNTIVYVERKGEKDWYGNIAKNTMVVTRPKYDYMNYPNETLGKVVAEFTLNEIETLPSIRYKANGAFYQYNKISDEILKKSCLTQEQILHYSNGNNLYALHIESLKIYDKPKELSEFGIKRAFQSWGYIWNK